MELLLVRKQKFCFSDVIYLAQNTQNTVHEITLDFWVVSDKNIKKCVSIKSIKKSFKSLLWSILICSIFYIVQKESKIQKNGCLRNPFYKSSERQ